MEKGVLRHGYTTGACAAAAVKGAAQMLRDQMLVDEVELNLPGGETVTFPLHGQEIAGNYASCHVIKDAGDDPDVTNGVEIHARVSIDFFQPRTVVIEGGEGIGKVTKPGLAVPVGEWAINPVPRRMIMQSVKEVFAMRCISATLTVRLSIPDGRERAKKTLNERLGIIGGLSILGTTGIVRPVSAQAWIDTIDAAVDVALACGSDTVVLSTGRTSELVAQKSVKSGDRGPGTKGRDSGFGIREPEGRDQKLGDGDRGTNSRLDISGCSKIDRSSHPQQAPRRRSSATPHTAACEDGGEMAAFQQPPPEEAFVMMGDHVGYALRACAAKGVKRVVLAGQFAKLLKIACGHEQTHVSSSELDLRALREWLSPKEDARLLALADTAATARHLLETSGYDAHLIRLVCDRARAAAERLTPGLSVKVLLAGYHGEMLYSDI